MAITSTAVINSSGSTLIITQLDGVEFGDLITTANILRTDQVTVTSVIQDSPNGNTIVRTTKNASGNYSQIYATETVSFSHLTNGVGLNASLARDAYFMRTEPSYDPEFDPRIPVHVNSVVDFGPNDTELLLDDVTRVANPTVSQIVSENTNATYFNVYDNGGAQVGDLVLLGLARTETNVHVRWVGDGNTYVGTTLPITANVGDTVYFQRAAQPRLRIGSEVISYGNINLDKGSVRDITRNIGNTQPASDWIWTAPNLVSVLGSTTL